MKNLILGNVNFTTINYLDVVILISVLIFTIYFWYKYITFKKSNKIILLDQNIKQDVKTQSSYRLKQNKKNVDFVASIIEGNYKEIMGVKKWNFVKAYSVWQELENKMSDEASPETIKKIKEFFKKRTRHEFYFLEAKISKNLPECKKELILENIFTDPFLSLHDMDDWAICEKATVVLTLKGVNLNNSKNYFIHIKEHFANHKITTGIIIFDVYKIA